MPASKFFAQAEKTIEVLSNMGLGWGRPTAPNSLRPFVRRCGAGLRAAQSQLPSQRVRIRFSGSRCTRADPRGGSASPARARCRRARHPGDQLMANRRGKVGSFTLLLPKADSHCRRNAERPNWQAAADSYGSKTRFWNRAGSRKRRPIITRRGCLSKRPEPRSRSAVPFQHPPRNAPEPGSIAASSGHSD